MEEAFTLSTEEEEIIAGIQFDNAIQRRLYEEKLYRKYYYCIREGSKKYNLSNEDAQTVYSDTILQVILNVVSRKFEGRSSLKTYLYQIFFNKCVDQVRKNTTHKMSVHQSTNADKLLTILPDEARNIVQKLVEAHDYQLLQQRLAQLGEKCKQLLLLFEDGYTDRQAAELTGYNNAAVVKTSRLRCMDKLKLLYGSKSYN
jgi:RNA polymerase sigma factor (sigma-70 family)